MPEDAGRPGLRFHRRFPFAGEPLSLGDLFRCHQRRNGVSLLDITFALITRGLGVVATSYSSVRLASEQKQYQYC